MQLLAKPYRRRKKHEHEGQSPTQCRGVRRLGSEISGDEARNAGGEDQAAQHRAFVEAVPQGGKMGSRQQCEQEPGRRAAIIVEVRNRARKLDFMPQPAREERHEQKGLKNDQSAGENFIDRQPPGIQERLHSLVAAQGDADDHPQQRRARPTPRRTPAGYRLSLNRRAGSR